MHTLLFRGFCFSSEDAPIFVGREVGVTFNQLYDTNTIISVREQEFSSQRFS